MKVKHSLFSRSSGIILSADVQDLIELSKLLQICTKFNEVVAIKIGFSLALRFSLPKITETVRKFSSLPIIYDHQKAGTDIPAMGKPFAKICKDSGVDCVIFFPHAGPVTLGSFVSEALNMSLLPIVGLIMTHDKYLVSEGGFISDEAPFKICETALALGVTSFVLPGTKLKITQEFANGILLDHAPINIMMPGIGSQGGSLQDSFKATLNHNHYAIIGSAIYKAPDPKNALKKFAGEVASYE